MSEEKSIFAFTEGATYHEEAPKINPEEFQKVIDSRRAVRVFTKDPIPEDIIKKCLENALLAPNSSNLQYAEFYRAKSEDKRKELVRACLSQPAAKNAPELFIVVARTKIWKKHAREMVDILNSLDTNVPAAAINYYKKLIPFVYTQGIFNILGLFKSMLFFIRGLKTSTIRQPVTKGQNKIVAIKSSALAAQNLMMSLRAYGYDSCPMEGYDSKLIKKILDLPKDAVPVMVISAGKRAPGGIYGERIRFDSSRFIKEV